MAIESYKVYRLFCKSAPKVNVTVVNGGNVVGTKLYKQSYLSNSTWQYVATGSLQVDEHDVRLPKWTQLSFQCNWESPQIYGNLHPAIVGKTTKVAGEQVKLNTYNGTTATPQDSRTAIKLIPANSTFSVNGYSYDAYYLEFVNGYVLDANNTYLEVNENTGADSQLFAFVPDRALRDTTSPQQGDVNTEIELNGKKNVDITLKTAGTSCQARIRKAVLEHNASSFSAFENYYSPSKSLKDDGFENGWGSNCSNSFSLEIEGANTTKQIDACKYEVTYRQNYEDPYHYTESVKSYITKQKINFDIQSAYVSSSELKITWNSDAFRSYGSVSVEMSDVTEDGELVCKGRSNTFTTIDSGTFSIPYSEIVKYPVSGSMISVTMKFNAMSEYAVGSGTITKNIIVETEGGTLEPVITVDTDNQFDLTLTITEKNAQPFDSCECSMLYENNGSVIVKKLKQIGTNKFFAPCRINAESYIVAAIEDTTSSIPKWGTKRYTHTYENRVATTLVINSENLEYEFVYADKKFPSEKTNAPANQSLHKSGKRLPDYYYETNSDNKFTINGLIFPTEDKPYVERVLRERYLVVRDSKGYYSNCAFISINYSEYDVDNTLCTLEFAEIDRTVDVAMPY